MSATGIAFRVDASAGTGSGHLVRCLALADELRARGVRTRFVARPLPEALLAAVRQRGHEVRLLPLPADAALDPGADVAATRSALADGAPWDWMVVDHYGLDERWETPARASARRILVVDDLADRRHDADVLVDPGCHPGGEAAYRGRVPSGCRILLGPSFAFLREEFRRPPPPARDPAHPRLNVCFGGTDPDGMTATAVRALRRGGDPRASVDVVIGSASPWRHAAEEACRELPGATLHVDATGMAGLLGRATLGIGAGGGMSWERCRMGLPSLVVSVAPNQRANARALAAARAAVDLGDAAGLDEERLGAWVARLLARPRLLERMGRRAAGLVDGRGAERVALLLARGPISFRRAEAGDARMAWLWRNHPFTRRFSVDSAALPWDSHQRWWTSSVASERRILLVARSRDSDVGVLRYDLDGPTATVSIYLDPGLAGLGLGPVVLREGTAWLDANAPSVERIHAVILPANAASVRSFVAAGYRPAGSDRDWERPVREPSADGRGKP
jgi:UDP-2,4-diacetamido-2,4,6-trideoxy-beta-L-altropyranose hydrolase